MLETTPENTALLITDASELIICKDGRYVCETYIFEPSEAESSLGQLFAVGETEDRNGVGRELLDLTVQALQREYYRDPGRGLLASFESALHQANLVLHDSAAQGVRDWMGCFHVAIGVMVGNALHVSTSGNAQVVLVRKQSAVVISKDLSYSPITEPLRTFAQVASGTLSPRDTLFFATPSFETIFRQGDLIRFVINHSAATINTRLEQLYADKSEQAPLSVLTVCLLPQHYTKAVITTTPHPIPTRRPSRQLNASLTPRQPLVISRSWLRLCLMMILRAASSSWQTFKKNIWPTIVQGSQQGSRVIVTASKKTGTKLQFAGQQQLKRWQGIPITPNLTISKPRLSPMQVVASWPKTLGQKIRFLPKSSQVFALLTVILSITLIGSLIFLNHKRVDDASIQRASELLHSAQTKRDAAETALVYDNRDQAKALIKDASTSLQALQKTGLYAPETTQIKQQLSDITDRLQRIQRITPENTHTIGDFKTALKQKTPTSLLFINDVLYTFDPSTNTIVTMDLTGKTSVASQTTEGIGFFTSAIGQAADKTILYTTSSPGLAIFDTKTNTLQAQDITFPSAKPDIKATASFGNRLYIYDQASNNIFSYSKTLRGYSGGTPWITNASFPKNNIISLGIDGNVYTLHNDGAVRKLLKGEPVDFKLEAIDPPLTEATKLIKSDSLKNIYILDTVNKRVVAFDAKGKLIHQTFFSENTPLSDITVNTDEKTLYVLSGTQVLTIPLD